MLSAKSNSLLILILLAFIAPLFLTPKAQAATGVTVTPANPTITLPKDHIEGQTTISFTNNYDRQVNLHLAVATAANATTADKQVPAAVTFDGGDRLILEPGQTATKTLRLHDQENLPPGSQRTDLVITQDAADGNVGISPQLRLPLITVKQDGAITAISLAAIDRPGLATAMPGKLGISLKNSGNMLAIPRGFVEITNSSGQVLAKGTINTDSLALAPGQTAVFSTPLTKLGSNLLPGRYRVNVSYGLGGSNPARVASTNLIYFAWWHIAAVVVLFAALYMATKLALKLKTRKPKRRAPSFVLAKREVP